MLYYPDKQDLARTIQPCRGKWFTL